MVNKHINPQVKDINDLHIFAAFSKAIYKPKSGYKIGTLPKFEYEVIASTFFTNSMTIYSINWGNMVSIMEQFGWNNLILVRVTDKVKQPIDKYLCNSENMKIQIITIPINSFFTDAWICSLLIENRMKADNIIYNFCGIEWHEILFQLKLHNITVSGGSTTKRHILSSVQLTLSQFITFTLGRNPKLAIESFNIANNKILSMPINDLTNKENTLYIEECKAKEESGETATHKDLEKEKEEEPQQMKTGELSESSVKSTISIQQKREYHSSSQLNNRILSSYLEEIKVIIDNISSEIAQQKIEDKWLELIKNKMTNEKDFVKKYGHLFC